MKAERLLRTTIFRLIGGCVVLAAVLRFTAPVSAPGKTAPLPGPVAAFAFGGRAVIGGGSPIDLGQTMGAPIFALVPDAAAAEELVKSSCLTDAPVMAPAAVVNPAVANDLPGLYGAPWVARFGDKLVALLDVAVPRDPLRDAPAPVLQVYRAGGWTPAYAATPAVSVYRGSQALLYRVFSGGPIRCLDLVVPNGTGTGTGYLYYPVGHRIFEARGTFTIQR